VIDPRSYPSEAFVGSSHAERGLFLAGFALLAMFVAMALWLLTIEESAWVVASFLGTGFVFSGPLLFAAVYLRGRRMKRVEERARFMASLKMSIDG
jgi:hypothetical protein